MERHEEVLVALRQIIRAVDLHSKKLNRELGITGPQLVLMQAIERLGEVTIKTLSVETNMSQATATTIIDRLENREMVTRVRSKKDRRVVNTYLTPAGKAVLQKAPQPLQDTFVKTFEQLDEWEQTQILSSVQRLSNMMNARAIDAAPLLHVEKL